MKFRKWFEVVELMKPKGARKSNIVRDAGTNTARGAIQYKWKTQLGSEVKLLFTPEGNDEYTVVFYVNNTLYDDAASNTENGRDPEILSGIFYLLKSKSEVIGAKTLSFRAHQSPGDTKIVRSLNIDLYKQQALTDIFNFSKESSTVVPNVVPPSERSLSLMKKINRPILTVYDFEKDRWLNFAKQVKSAIEQNESIYNYVNQLKTGVGVGDFRTLNFDINKLIYSLSNYQNAFMSNTEQGWSKTKNRRAVIYEKLLNRHMSNEWSISVRGDNFLLTKKHDVV